MYGCHEVKYNSPNVSRFVPQVCEDALLSDMNWPLSTVQRVKDLLFDLTSFKTSEDWPAQTEVLDKKILLHVVLRLGNVKKTSQLFVELQQKSCRVPGGLEFFLN